MSSNDTDSKRLNLRFFTKADVVLLILLIVIGTAGSVLAASGRSDGETVVIKVDGRLYGTYPLTADRTVTVEAGGGHNVIEIRDGSVSVTEASCRNQVCVKHAPVSRSGESIICLPNKVIVSIRGKGDDIDAVSS